MDPLNLCGENIICFESIFNVSTPHGEQGKSKKEIVEENTGKFVKTQESLVYPICEFPYSKAYIPLHFFGGVRSENIFL